MCVKAQCERASVDAHMRVQGIHTQAKLEKVGDGNSAPLYGQLAQHGQNKLTHTCAQHTCAQVRVTWSEAPIYLGHISLNAPAARAIQSTHTHRGTLPGPRLQSIWGIHLELHKLLVQFKVNALEVLFSPVHLPRLSRGTCAPTHRPDFWWCGTCALTALTFGGVAHAHSPP